MKKITTLVLALTLFAGVSCAKKTESASAGAPAESAEMATVENAAATADDKAPYTICTIDPKLNGKQAWEKILATYKGEVVLIDFWATWCPPCRRAMKEIDAIKPALMKKGARFVYITGETSPMDTWKEMVPNIHGDHYRLTDKQWGELCNQMEIPGIPAYILINKDGSTAFSNLSTGGYPGNEIIGNNIEVALTK